MSKPELAKSSDFALDCKLYIQLHAKQARLKARMEVLKERLLPELQAGKKSPRELPYTLVLRKRLRTLYDWKGALLEHLRIWLKSKEQADEQLAVIGAAFPQEETEALCVEINKAYAAKL